MDESWETSTHTQKCCFINLGALVTILLLLCHLQLCDRPTRTRFPWFFSFLDQMLSWYPKLTLHCILLVQPFPTSTSNLSSKKQSSKSDQNSWRCCLQSQPKCWTFFLCCTLPTIHFNYTSITLQLHFNYTSVFISRLFNLFPAYLFQKDEQGLPGNLPSNTVFFCFPHRNDIRSALHYISVSLIFLRFVLSHFFVLICRRTDLICSG